ncbi:hypothetical protein ACFX11_031856 [Malus domestica]
MIRVDGDTRLIRRMNMSNCQRLCENLAMDVSKMASAWKCYEVPSIILPGSVVPNWFSCRKDVRVGVDGTTTDPGCIFNGVCIYEGGDVFQLRSKETDTACVWLTYIPLPAHIKSKVDEGGDQSKPYLCRVGLHILQRVQEGLNGCGVHLGNFSMPEDGGEDDDDVGGEVRPRKKKRMLAIKG